MNERLQKILSRAGIASRRGAEKVLAERRITVNGETVTELGTKADVEKDDIRVDGVRIRPPKTPVYLLLYKPIGAVTTRHDPEGRQTVMELVPPVAGLFPVGRLDVTTEGLIILTNDGAFAERISHPRYEVPRVYRAKVRGVPDERTLARLTEGVRVEGDRLAADRVRVIDADNNAWVEVTLHEGKKHEVRRLLEAVGHPVSKLKRVAIGPVTDRGLEPGQFRHLTPEEMKGLLRGKGADLPLPKRTRRGPVRHPRSPAVAGAEGTAAQPARERRPVVPPGRERRPIVPSGRGTRPVPPDREARSPIPPDRARRPAFPPHRGRPPAAPLRRERPSAVPPDDQPPTVPSDRGRGSAVPPRRGRLPAGPPERFGKSNTGRRRPAPGSKPGFKPAVPGRGQGRPPRRGRPGR
jgi:23S rRNA pseudouridine2605 synthase